VGSSMKSCFRSTVAGAKFEGRQDVITDLGDDFKESRHLFLEAEREPLNEYDTNAIALYADGRQVGYIGREHSKHLAPYMDAGGELEVQVTEITGGEWNEKKGSCNAYGMNIIVCSWRKERDGA